MRERPRDKERLQHILEAIIKAEEFTKNISAKEFLKNKMLQYAVVKCFEIIGEAAYWTTNELRKNHSEVDWKNAISFRHVLVHDYFRIKIELVWNTVKIDIPVLKKQIQHVIAAEFKTPK